MASGDRIELLTADTFETAMSTVAQESTVETVNTNVATANTNISAIQTTTSTINTNVGTIKTSVGTASTAPSVTTAGGVVNTANTIQQKLQGISQYQIGATNSTGGSATAGNVMAKLNTIITAVGNLTSANGNSLHSNVFIPSDNLLKTIINTPTIIDSKVYLGCFVAKYAGALKIKFDVYCNSVNSKISTLYTIINARANYSNVYPSSSISEFDGNFAGDYYHDIEVSTETTSPQTIFFYPQVKAGDIIYFGANSFVSNIITITNLSVYGSVISYY